jgi:hypothetical protein
MVTFFPELEEDLPKEASERSEFLSGIAGNFSERMK